jgi:hypothetical protein
MGNKVQLKVNMIIGGTHYPFGSVLEEDFIPLRNRRPEYLGEPVQPGPVPDIEGYDLLEAELNAADYEEEVAPALTKAERRAVRRSAES